MAEELAGKKPERANCIYFFGDFTVYNRDKRDITYMFTARIKQIMCLVMQYSDGDGISSQLLSSLIWPEKSKDKVKNSRGVAMNHLRKILSELDGIELLYDKGRFKFVMTGALYCDYLRCLDFIENPEEPSANTREFLDIISRGKFLCNFDESIFDDFKRHVEARLERTLLIKMADAFNSYDYKHTVDFAEAEFNIDPVNESALSYELKSLYMLKKENTARGVYRRFIDEYRRTSGEDYPTPFSDYWGV